MSAATNETRIGPSKKEASAEVNVPAAAETRSRGQAGFAQSFAQIVAVLMRDRKFRTLTIGDLEWLVLPPVMAGQFALARAPVQTSPAKAERSGKPQPNSTLVPVAVALWARVSDHLDKSLSENLDRQPRLRAADWVSGDNLWLVAVAGNRRALPTFLEQLAERDFKGNNVKMRVQGQGGKVLVKTLGRSQAGRD